MYYDYVHYDYEYGMSNLLWTNIVLQTITVSLSKIYSLMSPMAFLLLS